MTTTTSARLSPAAVRIRATRCSMRCPDGQCAIAGAMFLVRVRLLRAAPRERSRGSEQLPQRFAKLILEPTKAKARRTRAAPGRRARRHAVGGEPAGGGGVTAPKPAAGPALSAAADRRVAARDRRASCAPSAGAAGRARAARRSARSVRATSAALASVARRTVGIARRSSDAALPLAARRGGGRAMRSVRSARAEGEIASVSGSGSATARRRRSRRLGGHELAGRDRRSLAGWRRRRGGDGSGSGNGGSGGSGSGSAPAPAREAGPATAVPAAATATAGPAAGAAVRARTAATRRCSP